MRAFRPAPQQEQASAQKDRTPSSRIPTKSSSSNASSKQGKSAQHVSQMAKRSSKSTAPSERSAQASVNAPVASKRQSVVPDAEIVRPANSAPSVARHSSVLLPPPTIRTPSLISAASTSTVDSPRSKSLRRKPSTIEQYKRGETPKADDSGIPNRKTNDAVDEDFDDSILGIALPRTEYEHRIPEFGPQFPADAVSSGYPLIRDITPPVPNYAQSVTPSTRYTDSPFSHVPTPSSASSISPAVTATNNSTTPRQRQQSPTRSRPPISGRSNEKNQTSRLGLPPVRESSTSSSNSTVKPSGTRLAQFRKDVPNQPATAPPGKPQLITSQNSIRGKPIKEQPKQTESSTNRNPAQIPPELAHLNVDPPSKVSLDKTAPPLRPTRDGTPVLTGMNAPSPVVQSDLPQLYTKYHKRTPSQDVPNTGTSPSLKTRFGFSSKSSSRQASPRIDSAISPPPTARNFTRGPTPDASASDSHRLARKDSPAIAPSPSKSPRFGFFSRKPKEDKDKPTEKPKRPPSKGPAAGTGHEGYGRFSMQRRSSSTSSSAGYRSPSTESNASSLRKRQSTSRKNSTASKDGFELDDFLRDRLNPVILRGSGSTVSNAPSGSDVLVTSGPNSSHNSSLDSFPQPQLLPSAMDSTAGTSPAKRSYYPRRAPSESSEDDVNARYPALTQSHPPLSQPTNRSATARQNMHSANRPSKDSHGLQNSSRLRAEHDTRTQDLSEGKEGHWLRSGKAEGERKAPRKWNFLQRIQSTPRDKGKGKAGVAPDKTNNPVHQAAPRGVTHYAMLDPVESIGLEEVEKIVYEAETSPEESNSEANAPSRSWPHGRQRRSMLPRPSNSEYSDDSEFSAPLIPPRIVVRQDSEDSSKLMYAERTVPHQAPNVVDIRRSPSSSRAEPGPEQKAIMSELRPVVTQTPEEIRTPDVLQAPFNTPDQLENNSPQRQPRLSPVGRIPPVVSRRDRERKLSDSSFSRPFARGQPKPTVKPPGSLYNEIREQASPIEPSSQPVSSTSTQSNRGYAEQKHTGDASLGSDSTNRTSINGFERGEFFNFPTRHGSDISYSSSSGKNSILAILAAQPPQEEDIWHEYNDLLDAVMSEKTHYSVVSPYGVPFQYSTALCDSPQCDLEGWYSQPPSIELPAPPTTRVVPAVLSVPQIARFMQPSFSPLTTPQALSDVFSHYGNRSTSTLMSANYGNGPEQNRASTSQQSRSSIPGPSRAVASGSARTKVSDPNRSSVSRSVRSSTGAPNRSSLPRSNRSSLPSARGSVVSSARHSRGSVHSRSASLPEANARNSQSSLTPSVRFNRDAQLLDIAEVDGDAQAAAASLRFGALMTSKWLSFGRVLFSPAHHEMRLASEARVLIIDGLGSDWSYYVAISYPTATIYNLGPAHANGMSDWPGVNEKAPSNHRYINHATISAAFPFPKGFFTAVVFRFPLATTDQAYQACMFECKRVLRPGGFIEVAALDLDLMNMGNKARKELRGLKTRLQQHRQDISLRNLSDMLVGLIGRRGFEDVQRCIVGVPAAGHIPKSQDMSSVSSGASGRHVWQREDRQSREFSFADLLEDARANQSGETKCNDENITKMVAKVGRWWYSACYEKALLKTDKSIWQDTALLRECEKQGTSFRLLICYAQKPAQTRRRTVSV